jgi:hypothetical protein
MPDQLYWQDHSAPGGTRLRIFNEGTSMKITLDDGTTFDVSGAAAAGRLTAAERTTIRNALHDAAQLLDQDHHVIASIAADISASVSRIEVELGAHPAFTWAQTKLGNAIAHLEAYVKGEWEEPKQSLVPTGTAFDQRGVLVAVAPAPAPSAASQTLASTAVKP